MVIRRFGRSDRERVLDVHAEAFRRPDTGAGDPPEVGLLVELLDEGDVIDRLSLVAFHDGRPPRAPAAHHAGITGQFRYPRAFTRLGSV